MDPAPNIGAVMRLSQNVWLITEMGLTPIEVNFFRKFA
jgi:hypothetical protein